MARELNKTNLAVIVIVTAAIALGLYGLWGIGKGISSIMDWDMGIFSTILAGVITIMAIVAVVGFLLWAVDICCTQVISPIYNWLFPEIEEKGGRK